MKLAVRPLTIMIAGGRRTRQRAGKGRSIAGGIAKTRVLGRRPREKKRARSPNQLLPRTADSHQGDGGRASRLQRHCVTARAQGRVQRDPDSRFLCFCLRAPRHFSHNLSRVSAAVKNAPGKRASRDREALHRAYDISR